MVVYFQHFVNEMERFFELHKPYLPQCRGMKRLDVDSRRPHVLHMATQICSKCIELTTQLLNALNRHFKLVGTPHPAIKLLGYRKDYCYSLIKFV